MTSNLEEIIHTQEKLIDSLLDKSLASPGAGGLRSVKRKFEGLLGSLDIERQKKWEGIPPLIHVVNDLANAALCPERWAPVREVYRSGKGVAGFSGLLAHVSDLFGWDAATAARIQEVFPAPYKVGIGSFPHAARDEELAREFGEAFNQSRSTTFHTEQAIEILKAGTRYALTHHLQEPVGKTQSPMLPCKGCLEAAYWQQEMRMNAQAKITLFGSDSGDSFMKKLAARRFWQRTHVACRQAWEGMPKLLLPALRLTEVAMYPEKWRGVELVYHRCKGITGTAGLLEHVSVLFGWDADFTKRVVQEFTAPYLLGTEEFPAESRSNALEDEFRLSINKQRRSIFHQEQALEVVKRGMRYVLMGDPKQNEQL